MSAPLSYNPANWYWIVGDTNPSTQVYSSARAAFVANTDATYEAWVAAGNAPTSIDTAANLSQVFAQQFPAGWPGGDSVGILAAGCQISSPTRSYLNETYALDLTHVAYNDGLEAYMLKNSGELPGGGSTVPIATVDGRGVLVQAADVGDVLTAIASYVTEVLTAARLKALGQSATYPAQPTTIA